MDAMEQSAAIQALALALSRSLTQEQASRLGLLLVQLGTTLGTIAALQQLNAGETASDSDIN